MEFAELYTKNSLSHVRFFTLCQVKSARVKNVWSTTNFRIFRRLENFVSAHKNKTGIQQLLSKKPFHFSGFEQNNNKRKTEGVKSIKKLWSPAF